MTVCQIATNTILTHKQKINGMKRDNKQRKRKVVRDKRKVGFPSLSVCVCLSVLALSACTCVLFLVTV